MVCFSLPPVWFFFVNNFCNSCLSFVKSFIKPEELFKHHNFFCIISLVLNSLGKYFIFSAICDSSFMPSESIIIPRNSIFFLYINFLF